MMRFDFSRRDFLRWTSGGVALLAGLSACSSPAMPAPRAPTAAPMTRAPAPTLAPEVPLEVKLGQMLMVGFRGATLAADAPILRDIRERHLGSVVLFDYDVVTKESGRNVQSPAQLRALTADLQRAAKIPLLLAADQEGGMIARLKERYGFPATVSHATLGARNDLAFTRAQAGAMAQTLADAGINLNLAPCVDVNTNPANPIIAKYERSFSPDPQIVAAHALEFIRAHHAQRVRCTLKHFPGHGSSTGDTHAGVTDVTQTWARRELDPYRAIIRAGLADAIMTAHVFNAQLDANDPATLSQPIIGDLLRGELQYAGVVISDDLQMGAITTQYGFETAIRKALEAGVDILALANNLTFDENIVERTLAVIKQLLAAGTIREARIDQAYRRIMELKSRL